jgi:uncharacterized protein
MRPCKFTGLPIKDYFMNLLISRFEQAFGQWIIQHRIAIIFITMLLLSLPVYWLKLIYFDSEYRNFIGDSLPSVIDMKFIEETFNKQDNILIVIAPDNGDVFTPTNLALIETLTEQAWLLPFTQRVNSLSNFQHTKANGDDLWVDDLVRNAAAMDAATIVRIKATALAEPRLKGNLISIKGDVTGINIIVDPPSENKTGETKNLVEKVTTLIEEHRSLYPNIQFFINGTVFQDHTVERVSREDMKSLVPIVLLLMTVILLLTIRNVIAVVLTLLVVALSIISALGIGSFLGIHITPPVAASPTIILTVAIASCVHILVNFIDELQHHGDKNTAIKESLRVNLQPVSLACITTVFGFLTLNFAETPPFRDLGNMVSIGVISALLLSLFTLPACLSLAPIRLRPKANNTSHTIMATLSQFIITRHTQLLWLTLAILILSLIAAFNNVFNDNPLKYFKKTNSYRVSTEFTNERLTGLTTLEFYLESGQPGGINEPAFLRDVDAFADWFETQPRVLHVNSLSDTMKRLNRNMHGDDETFYSLPAERDLSAQYLLLYELSLPYGFDLANEINLDKSALRLVANIATPDDVGFMKLQADAIAWIEANAPNIVDAKASGLFFAYSSVSVASSKVLLLGTFLALGLISLSLMLVFQSYTVGLVSFISNMAPAIVGFGVWGLFVGEIGGGTSVVSAVTIGIVVDDTVHMFSKYFRARREHNLAPEAAIEYALKTVGRALAITSVVLIAGFLVLLFSDFRLNFEMGSLTSIVIACALGTVFLLVPSLLMKFPNIK